MGQTFTDKNCDLPVARAPGASLRRPRHLLMDKKAGTLGTKSPGKLAAQQRADVL